MLSRAPPLGRHRQPEEALGHAPQPPSPTQRDCGSGEAAADAAELREWRSGGGSGGGGSGSGGSGGGGGDDDGEARTGDGMGEGTGGAAAAAALQEWRAHVAELLGRLGRYGEI